MIKKLRDFIVPPTLYKFREWNNKFHKELISKQIAFFASPGSFNDPFDCRIPIRYDIEPEKQLEEIYYKFTKAKYPNEDDAKIRAHAKNYVSIGSIEPSHFQKNGADYFLELDERMGIFSLTKHNDDILMWGHYASSHRGFCLGFDTEELLKISDVDYIGKVRYLPEFPTIVPSEGVTDNFEEQIFTKWDRWSYEDEFRLTKNHIKNRKIKLPASVFKEIILGYNMNPKERIRLSNLAKKKFPKIKIYEAKPNEEEFKIEIIEIA